MEIIRRKLEFNTLKKVAAYVRVSSDKLTMRESSLNQVTYFSKLIQNNPDWLFAGIFIDEGISGTKGDRVEFSKMLNLAHEGKIDLILVKSLSRFARNTVDCLRVIREMKAIDVDIFFEEQNIHTLSSGGELLISILSATAQEEAKANSERTLWRVKKNFAEGKPYGGGVNCLGYRLVKGKVVINKEEVPLVKRIFSLYLSGYGVNKIAKILNDDHVPTKTGSLWKSSTLEKILRNPIYKGDLLLQKTFVDSYLNKKDIINKGEKPRYYVEDNHEAIIPREDFDRVPLVAIERMKLNTSKSPRPKGNPALVHKIKCGCCDSYYRYKVINGKNQIYICNRFNSLGKNYCTSKQIRESIIIEKANEVLNLTQFDESVFLKEIKVIISVYPNILVFRFNDGREKTVNWENPSRRESWTPEMKQKMKERKRNVKSHRNSK